MILQRHGNVIRFYLDCMMRVATAYDRALKNDSYLDNDSYLNSLLECICL